MLQGLAWQRSSRTRWMAGHQDNRNRVQTPQDFFVDRTYGPTSWTDQLSPNAEVKYQELSSLVYITRDHPMACHLFVRSISRVTERPGLAD